MEVTLDDILKVAGAVTPLLLLLGGFFFNKKLERARTDRAAHENRLLEEFKSDKNRLLEEFKADNTHRDLLLQNELDRRKDETRAEREIARLHTQTLLDITKEKDRLSFAKLFERKYEIMAQIYKLIFTAYAALSQVIKVWDTGREGEDREEIEKRRRKDFVTAWNEFLQYVGQNGLFIGATLDGLLDQWFVEVNHSIIDWDMGGQYREMYKDRMAAYKKVRGMADTILKEMKAEMRRELGILDPKSEATTVENSTR
jgi:hypothetical protein